MIGREPLDYNKSLGDRRATTVKEYLIELGCEANRIEVISLGDELAIPDADSEQSRLDQKSHFCGLQRAKNFSILTSLVTVNKRHCIITCYNCLLERYFILVNAFLSTSLVDFFRLLAIL